MSEDSTTQSDAAQQGDDSTLWPGTALLPLHTPAEAARILSVRESWLRRRAGERRIPCTFLGRHLRFSRADITDIAAGGAQPAHTPPAHRGHRSRPGGGGRGTTGPESPRRRARRHPGMERS